MVDAVFGASCLYGLAALAAIRNALRPPRKTLFCGHTFQIVFHAKFLQFVLTDSVRLGWNRSCSCRVCWTFLDIFAWGCLFYKSWLALTLTFTRQKKENDFLKNNHIIDKRHFAKKGPRKRAFFVYREEIWCNRSNEKTMKWGQSNAAKGKRFMASTGNTGYRRTGAANTFAAQNR